MDANIEEIWKDIPGYENRYQISNLGNCRSLTFRVKTRTKYGRISNGRVLKPHYARHGYALVVLGHKGKTLTIHRLVAQSFIPNTFNKPCVNHIDGNKQNNTVKNLEWVTYSENEKHSYSVLGKKNFIPMLGKHGLDNHESEPVIVWRLSGDFIDVFQSGTDAANALGVQQTNLSKVTLKQRNHTGGYVIRKISKENYYQFKTPPYGK